MITVTQIFILVMALKCVSKHNIRASIVNQFLMHQILIRSVIYFRGLYFCNLIISRLGTSIWSTNYFVHNRFSIMYLATTTLRKHVFQIIIIVNGNYFLGNIMFKITIRFILKCFPSLLPLVVFWTIMLHFIIIGLHSNY